MKPNITLCHLLGPWCEALQYPFSSRKCDCKLLHPVSLPLKPPGCLTASLIVSRLIRMGVWNPEVCVVCLHSLQYLKTKVVYLFFVFKMVSHI